MVCAKHYVIRGRVQAVGYRFFTLEAAARWGIQGYVRNLAGGEVEIHAEGEPGALDEFKNELQRGPRIARVTEIKESDVPVTSISSFFIRG